VAAPLPSTPKPRLKPDLQLVEVDHVLERLRDSRVRWTECLLADAQCAAKACVRLGVLVHFNVQCTQAAQHARDIRMGVATPAQPRPLPV
jgi:hypothetical protein